MQSSRSGADPLDPGSAGYAHRGLHNASDVPENTLAAFDAALAFGAGIECDLRLTADDHIVVFHDATAWRLCASRMRIAESSRDDLRSLRIGGQPIPTLASLLSLVGARVPMLLEVKVNGDVHRWIPALRRELAGFAGSYGVMSFDPRVSRLLKRSMPDVRRGLVVRDNLASVPRQAAMWVADPQFLSVERPALGKSWVERARRRMPVYSWTVRTSAERVQAEVQADALIWEADGRPRI